MNSDSHWLGLKTCQFEFQSFEDFGETELSEFPDNLPKSLGFRESWSWPLASDYSHRSSSIEHPSTN